MNTQRQEHITELSVCCTCPIEFSRKVVPILWQGDTSQGSREVITASVFRRQANYEARRTARASTYSLYTHTRLVKVVI
jgi:hypothetical protein